MEPGIVLIHGYTGAPSNLKPLSHDLIKTFGKNAVKILSLPGHGHNSPPSFDEKGFIEYIAKEVAQYKNQNRRIIIIGHSTGGNLFLACMRENGITPDYLVLAGTPFQIDSGAYERWSEHRKGCSPVSFTDMAGMVSLINRTCRPDYFSGEFHTLIINGEDDRLVPASDTYKWEQKFPENKTRVVLVPHADHDIFCSPYGNYAIDVIIRAITDVMDDQTDNPSELISAEPEVEEFLTASPFSLRHLAMCPGNKGVTGSQYKAGPFCANEPVFANIEITTRCNFRCKYCARSNISKDSMDMDKTVFKRILDLLPHAYRVTLVGLGEPLLHPDIIEFIEIASSKKRRVGLVTNASLLDESISKELISAGLDSIAFSLDSADQETASLVRNGTDVDRVVKNIRQFIKIADSKGSMAKAVFTALSIETLPYFDDLIDTVSTLGVDIMMLTDLNFTQNVKKSVANNVDTLKLAQIRNSIKKAFVKNLPVLSVHALEEFGLRSRYRDFLLLPPDQIIHRSRERKYCFSPWQTVPVDVKGNITMCDCQPEKVAGNILTDPFNMIWNGKLMSDYRERMVSDNPLGVCRICPRF